MQRQRTDAEAVLADPTPWRDQTVIVRGAHAQLARVHGGRLLHGSQTELPIGTILEPQQRRNHRQSPAETVSITSELATALHWARAAGDGAPIVYEVEPLGPVDGHRVALADRGRSIALIEGRVTSVRIIGIVPHPSPA